MEQDIIALVEAQNHVVVENKFQPGMKVPGFNKTNL